MTEFEMEKLDVTWHLELDDERLELRPDDITPAHAAALRLQSGGAWRVPVLLISALEACGPEEVAGLVFLARRQAGEDVTYPEVMLQIEAARRFKLTLPDEIAEAPDPEA